MMKNYKLKTRLTIMLTCFVMAFITLNIKAQTIYSENFESAWTNASSLVPAWSGTTTPANAVWQKTGYTTGWTSATGAYAPLGANSTLASARFHTYDTPSLTSGDFISPTIDLSAYTAGTLQMDFYHINTSGSDALNVYVSDDNGLTWTSALAPSPIISSAAWTLKTIVLPGNSATTKIKFTATSDWGTTDIGIDEIRVYVPAAANGDPINFTATAVTQTGMTIGWTDNSTNESKFRVYRSTNNIIFTQQGTDIASTTTAATGGTYSQVQTGTSPGTTYYFKIAAVADLESNYLLGTQATLAGATYYWVGATGGLWSLASNWNTMADGSGTTRSVVAATDVLIVDGAGTTPGVATMISVDVASFSIGQLLITSNTACTLQSSITTTRTITITGGPGDDFVVENGSTLNLINATNAVAFAFSGIGNTGNIAGTVNFAGSTSNTLTTSGGTGTLVTVPSTGIVNLGFTGNSLVGTVASLSFVDGSNCNSTGATTGAPPVPLATWSANSNLTISGITTSTTGPTNNAQSFGNVTYNCPAATGTMSFWAATTTAVVKGNLNINATNTGKFRALTGGAITINGNLNVSGGTFEVASTSGIVNVLGNVNLSGGTLDMTSGTSTATLKVTGNFLQTAGTLALSGTSTTSSLEFNGFLAQTFTPLTVSATLLNVKINNLAGVSLAANLPIRNLTVTSGSLTGAGLLSYNATASTLLYNASNSLQTVTATEFPLVNGPLSLTINNTTLSPNNIVNMPFSRSLSGTTGVFTLTAGILNNSTYLLSVPNTAVAAIVGGSATSYVKGAIARNLPASYVTVSNYNFPVGKGTFNPFALVNPTTNAGGTVTVQAEVFDANCGGTAGTLMGTLNSNRYWAASTTAGAANLIGSLIQLNDAPAGADGIAASATLAGAYNLVGGTAITSTATSLTSTAPAATTLPGYFVMGNKAAATLTNLLITPSGNQCTNIARTVTVTATPGGGAVTGVVINYSVNGTAQAAIVMTNIPATNDWTGVIPTVTPTNANVIWSVTATDANLLTKTATGIAYKDEPNFGIVATASSAPASICFGANASLNVLAAKSGLLPLGAGATASSSAGASFLPGTWGGAKTQYLIKASELTAIGLTAGNITSVAFDPTTSGQTYTGFSLSMASTALTAMTTSFVTTGLTQVYLGTTGANNGFIPTANVANTLAFGTGVGSSTSFYWDGTSNIVLSYSWSSVPNATTSTSSTMKVDAPGYTCTTYRQADNEAPATMLVSTTGTTAANRPRFTFTSSPVITAYSWSDGSTVVGTTNPLSVNPTATTSYTCTVTGSGCPITSNSVTLTVLPLPTAPTATNSSQCGTLIPLASVTATAGAAGTGVFNWYANSSGGVALQSSTAAAFGSPISVTTTLYVSESGVNGCESARTPVTITVALPDALTASASLTSIACLGSSTAISVAQTGTNNTYALSWSLTSYTGSGLSGVTSASLNTPITVTPTVAGTYIYTITGFESASGCQTTSSVSVTSNNPVAGVTATSSASTSTVCSGSPTVLTTVLSSASPASYIAPPAVTYPTSDEDFAKITITQGATTIVNNTSANNSLTGTIGLALGTVGSYSDFTGFGPYNMTAGQAYNFSMASSTSATAYSNAMAIYIDYNRNGVFTDAGEAVYLSTATVSGAHTETGAFTIPASALNGLTRMRIIVNEGLVTGPTMTVNYGEYEEYLLNISSANNGGGALVTASSYSWSDGSTAVGTTNPLTVSPIANTTYQATATVSGCPVVSNTVAIATLTLPTAPTATNSSQCGTQIPLASVASAAGINGNGTFNWYANSTGGVALQSSTSINYNSTIAVTTTLYVSESGVNGCESARTPVTVTVGAAPALTLSAATSSICSGIASSAITVTSTVADFNSYTWNTLTNITGSEVSGWTFNPTATATYTLTANNSGTGCSNTAIVAVTVNPLPLVTAATTSVEPLCEGSSTTLTAVSIPAAGGTAVSGTGTTLTSTYGYPTAFENYWYQNWQQYLFKASELTAMGIVPGNITTIALNIAALPNPNTAIADYNIRIGTTSSSALSTFTTTGLTNVYGPSSVTAVLGVNTFTLTTPFNWDGVSNIIIDLRQTGHYGSGNSTTYYTSTSYNSVLYAYSTSNNLTYWTTSPTPSTSLSRPNITFGGQVGNNLTSTLNWSWSPATGLSGTTGNTVTASPTATTLYTVTATNPVTTCSASQTVNVTVNPKPIAPVSGNISQCGITSPIPAVNYITETNGYTTPTFNWYSASTGGVAILSSTDKTLAPTLILGVNTFYVSVTNPSTGCESNRTIVTITVATPPVFALSSNATAICAGSNSSAITITSGAIDYNTYSWSPSVNVSGNSTSGWIFNPTTSSTYTLTASNSGSGCVNTTNVVVTVNPLPLITSATSSVEPLCSGSSTTLTAVSNIATTAIGSGTSLTAATAQPTAFCNRWPNYWSQTIYTVADLNAAGLVAGNITSLAYNVATLGDAATNANFTVNIGATSNINFATTTFVSTAAFTNVYGPSTYTHTATGWNVITFTAPYVWDGVSNIIIEITHDGADAINNSQTYYTATSDNKTLWVNSYTGTTTTGTLSLNRLNIKLAENLTSTYNWTWSPSTGLNNTTSNVVTANPTVTTLYTVTATNPTTTCSASQTVNVTVLPVVTKTQTLTVCAGVTVTVGGNAHTTTGTYVDVITAGSYTGCDSTVTTNLTVRPASASAQTLTVCAGTTVTIGGNAHTTTGIFTDIVTGGSYTGCDSTVTTNLTVRPVITGSKTITVCAGGSVTVGGNIHTTTGIYTDVVTGGSYTGCDSTVTTNLTVRPAVTNSQTLTLCSGGSITVGGTTHNTSGTYTDIVAGGSYTGCDSTVTSNLTILPAATSTKTITLCAGGSITVGGNTHTTTGVYTDVIPYGAVNGCDSTAITNLTVISTINVSTTVVANVITANSTTATYQWLDCDNANAIIAGEIGQSYTALVSGNYAVIVTEAGTCSDTSACVNVFVTGISSTGSQVINISPNPTSGIFTLDIENANTNEVVITIVDIQGKVVYNELDKNISAKYNKQIDLSDLSKGIYFVKLSIGSDVKVEKLVVQ